MSTASDFTEGRIFPKLIKFMLPILGALVLQAMYGAVDILVVGQFGTNEGISAVSTGSNLVNMVTFTAAGFTMGVTILMGRYLGEKKPERLGKVIGGAICFFVVLSLVITAVMLIFARQLAQLMQAPVEALDSTVTYVMICGGGILFIMAYNFISSVFRGLGNSKLPLIFVGIACVVNIIGDLLFVAVFKMNVAGAALATVLAQAVSVALSIVIIRKQKLPFTLKKEDIRFNEEVPRIIRVGAPIAVQELLTQLSFLALCAFINKLGIAQSSGYGVACKLVAFIMLVPSSLMQSLASFVAQNFGAGKEKRARRTMLCGMAIGCSVGVVISLATVFAGNYMSMIFTPEPAYIEQSAAYLLGFSLEPIVTSVLFSFIGYFNGHSQTLFVMIQGLSQTFLVRLPMSYYMSIQPDASLTMIGLAAPSATIFGIILNLVYFIWYTKKLRRTQPELEH
ncbi:putative Na+-driven multidrug efflux pump [Eubacterium sp. CAG:786]|nr:putative Na+-driven multidrug efflux pump [Eubacterium sp. CAG:786]